MIHITIAGECVPKGRPRFTRSGRVYTPKETLDYEKLVQQQIKLQRIKPVTGAVRLTLVIYREVPKGWSKKKKNAAIRGEHLPVTRPDLDNYLKVIMDASNGLLYKDDNQVVEILASKRYAKMPYVEIILEELNE